MRLPVGIKVFLKKRQQGKKEVRKQQQMKKEEKEKTRGGGKVGDNAAHWSQGKSIGGQTFSSGLSLAHRNPRSRENYKGLIKKKRRRN